MTDTPGECGCGHDQRGPEEVPVLDARAIPHEVRRGAVLGAFDALAPGSSLILVAPHDPVPLLAQMTARAPITVRYLQTDPGEWRLHITKQPARAGRATALPG